MALRRVLSLLHRRAPVLVAGVAFAVLDSRASTGGAQAAGALVPPAGAADAAGAHTALAAGTNSGAVGEDDTAAEGHTAGDGGEEAERGEAHAESTTCPGPFDSKEDEKGFTVHPVEGLNLVLQCSVGPASREGASVGAHIGLSSQGANAVWVVSDQRSPPLQAVLQPGQDGKALKLSGTARPLAEQLPGLSAEGEVVLAAAGLQGAKLTCKLAGDDYFSTLAFQPFGPGGAPPNFDLSYHQTVAEGLTLGGALQGLVQVQPGAGLLGLPGLSAQLPAVALQRVLYQTFGSWRNARGDMALLVRLGQQPQRDGSAAQALSLQAWRRATRTLELGAHFSAQAPQSLLAHAPDESAAGVGCRMTFEGHPGGMSPTLTAHLSSALVASVSLVKPSASNWSNTFMRSTLTAVLDHRQRDFKLGATLELYY